MRPIIGSLRPTNLGSETAAAGMPKYSGVQGLRFVAALLVVVTHATLYTSERLNSTLHVWTFGGIGVHIFFVISGFVMVISSGALTKRPDGWKYFAMRRVIRIVPIYWIATTVKLLTLIAVPSVVLHTKLDVTRTFLSYVFLPSRNIDGNIEPLLGVGWTLTFEVAFYAVFAVGLFFRISPLKFCGIVLSVAAVGNVFRGESWPPWAVYFDPFVLYFLAGMIIANYTINRCRIKCALGLLYVVGLFSTIHVVAAAKAGNFNLWYHVILSPAVIALVLAVVIFEPIFVDRIPRFFTFMGDASYSLYLFHPIVAPTVPTALSIMGLTSPSLSVSLCILAAVVASALIYYLLERPTTHVLKSRLPYVRTGST